MCSSPTADRILAGRQFELVLSARKVRNTGAGRTSAPDNRRIRNALIEAGHRGPEARSDVRLVSRNARRRPPTELRWGRAPTFEPRGIVGAGRVVPVAGDESERTEGRCAEIAARV